MSSTNSVTGELLLLLSAFIFLLSFSFPVQAQDDWLSESFRKKSSATSIRSRNIAPWKYKGVRASQKPRLTRLIHTKRIKKGSEVYLRIFKQENQLELWMRKGKRFTLVKSYPICKWSGKLGPKLRQGDKQAPEGFYRVSPKSMNPASKYHLSFNLGYPNRLERTHGRTGSYLMVHGKCVSAGCYAMTDPVIEEIYGLMKQAFNAGQKIIHVHAFPFRMTAANIDKFAGHKWESFWWNLKQGYDIFEATLLPPDSEACAKSYVFNPPPLTAGGIPNPSWSCMMKQQTASSTDKKSKIKTARY